MADQRRPAAPMTVGNSSRRLRFFTAFDEGAELAY